MKTFRGIVWYSSSEVGKAYFNIQAESLEEANKIISNDDFDFGSVVYHHKVFELESCNYDKSTAEIEYES